MSSAPPFLSFLLLIAAGWVHRHQLIVIEFLQAENRLLKDRLRGRRIRFTDAERAVLRNNSRGVRVQRLQRPPDSGMMSACRWRERSSE